MPAADVSSGFGCPIKHNFNEEFDVPQFTGTSIKFETNRRGNLKTDKAGKPIPIRVPRDIGGIRPSFKQKYNLTANSKPWQFADVFLPFQHKENDENLFSFEKLADWTNAKAIMNGAGNRIYKDEWTPFTPKEIRQHFGLYVMHGLAPTPRVEYKFRPQRVLSPTS